MKARGRSTVESKAVVLPCCNSNYCVSVKCSDRFWHKLRGVKHVVLTESAVQIGAPTEI